MNERIHINSEDDETGEFVFVNVTLETARILIATLQSALGET